MNSLNSRPTNRSTGTPRKLRFQGARYLKRVGQKMQRMFVKAFYCLVCCLGLPMLAHSEDCEKLQSGSGMWSDCLAANRFKEADAKLNASYKKVMTILKDNNYSKQKTMLITSQRTWLKYREEYCNFVYEWCSGSSAICASLYTNCGARLSISRANELDIMRKEWTNEDDEP